MLFKYSLLFLTGVFVGQEFKEVPNLRKKSIELYTEFQKTDFYKSLTK